MTELASVNGRIVPVEDAVVSVEDRGYQFADAIYEVIGSYQGKLFCMDEHLQRLEKSANALRFSGLSLGEIRKTAESLYERSGIPRAVLYIQISRGVAPRNHAFPKQGPLQVIMTVREVKAQKTEIWKTGVKVITADDIRWGRCNIKTVQLLPNVMAKQQALDAGAFDAVFVVPDGPVREATSANLFIIKNKILVTHPLTPQILAGITRSVVIDLAVQQGYSVEERFFSVGELFEADEVFLTGTITEVLPVVDIDGHPVGDGSVGPISIRLQTALLDHIGGS